MGLILPHGPGGRAAIDAVDADGTHRRLKLRHQGQHILQHSHIPSPVALAQQAWILEGKGLEQLSLADKLG